MSGLTYDELISELFPRLTGGIRWGLDRTLGLLASVGNPQQSFRSIHIGGTNGKGSVAATLSSILRTSGRRTGLYTSPHLCTFRERIQIDGMAISEAALLNAAEKLWPQIMSAQPSFFEATTAIAFLALAEADVEVAVVEVGLGGRLDATNVVDPELAVITNIALDHADYLGNTIALVAHEKAGIIKAGRPILTAERDAAVLAMFRERAAGLSAPLHVLPADQPRNVAATTEGTRFDVTTEQYGTLHLQTPLVGAHQATNSALAVHAAALLPAGLRPDQQAVIEGVARVPWPGRLQVELINDQLWLFDVAHNVAGVNALADAVRNLVLPRPLVAVVGILGDKDWKAMLPPLFDLSDAAILTLPPTAPGNRAWNPHDVLAEVPCERAEVIAPFYDALDAAARRAGEGTVLVTGSFHTVGDALMALGRAPAGVDLALPRLTFSG